ncbi:MAG: site-specific integrase [Propionibacterium sp.]|nr:site-specific integrase [Propionibacterium sp.]
MSKRRPRDKGDGGLYKNAQGLWTAAITLPADPITGKRRRKVVRSKSYETARTKLDELKQNLAESGDLPTASPTVAAWMTYWLDNISKSRNKPRTHDGYRGYVNRYIVPQLGRIKLDKLTPADVTRMRTTITDPAPKGLGLSSTTALQAHSILRKALRDAQRVGRVRRNVATLVDAPSKRVARMSIPTTEETVQFLTYHAADPYVARYFLQMCTGCRQGEALGAHIEHIDLTRDGSGKAVGGKITFAWQVQRLRWEHGCGDSPCGRKRAAECPQRHFDVPDDLEGEQLHGALWRLRPKTATSFREVALVPQLAEVLDRIIGDRTEGLVFTEGGHPVDPRRDWGRWSEWLKDAGLPHYTDHALRHMVATVLNALGTDERTRMDVLGHSVAATTRGYTHGDLTLQAKAMGQLGAALTWEPRFDEWK